MEVDPGEVVVIFGRSGSGKSTLLRCVNFLEDPTSGMIEVAGVRLEGGHRTKGKREQVRQLRIKAGMVFQQFNLFPNMTVIGNVIEGPVTVKGIPEAQAKAHGLELLHKVGLSDKADEYPIRLVRWSAAARRHRPGVGHGARGHALRRAHLGPGPRAHR